MSVLVKDMDMPTSCSDCPIGDALGCPFIPGIPARWKEYDIAIRTNRRHSHCPLGPAADVEEPSKPSWISVTERLPEPYTWVLVSAENHKVALDAFFDGDQWKDAVLNGLIVTHWMPLPEPPKEEKRCR